eukprot:scaffold13132_cov16-Tisochrysis_lutea.AAC.2
MANVLKIWSGRLVAVAMLGFWWAGAAMMKWAKPLLTKPCEQTAGLLRLIAGLRAPRRANRNHA